MKKSQVLLSSLLILSLPAVAQTGAGAGANTVAPNVSAPNTATPTTAAPPTNTIVSPTSETSGAIQTRPNPANPRSNTGGVANTQTVQPGVNSQANQLPTTQGTPRVQDPTARPCPPTVSSGGADRPRVGGSVAANSANCIPTQN